jgi:hypothetical protein
MTTVVGLITINDEVARALVEWCQENNLSLNVNKMKERIVGDRRQQREHSPIHINKAAVESVKSFKFHRVYVTDDVKWSIRTDSMAEQIWLGP